MQDSEAAVRSLVTQGGNVNAAGVSGVTPLMIAVDQIKLNAIKALLSAGADVNAKASDGTTAIFLLLRGSKQPPLEALNMLFAAGANPNTLQPNKDPIVVRALNDQNEALLRYLVGKGASLDVESRTGERLLHYVALATDWNMVELMIQLGARIDEPVLQSQLIVRLKHPFPSSDSPIFSAKKRVWELFKSKGYPVQALGTR